MSHAFFALRQDGVGDGDLLAVAMDSFLPAPRRELHEKNYFALPATGIGRLAGTGTSPPRCLQSIGEPANPLVPLKLPFAER